MRGSQSKIQILDHRVERESRRVEFTGLEHLSLLLCRETERAGFEHIENDVAVQSKIMCEAQRFSDRIAPAGLAGGPVPAVVVRDPSGETSTASTSIVGG